MILKSASKVLDVLLAISAHPIDGVSNKDLASGLALDAPFITKAVDTLAEKGLVYRLPTGRIAPASRLLGIAVAYQQSLDKAQRRLNELQTSVAAKAAQYQE